MSVARGGLDLRSSVKAARWLCMTSGLAMWAAGLLIPTSGFAADVKKKAVPQGHARASSYAPQQRAQHRAYGAPIQKPILSKHKRPKRRTTKSASR